ALAGGAVLGQLVLAGGEAPAQLVRNLGGDRHRFGGGGRVRVGDQRRGLHSSSSTAAATAASRSSSSGPEPPHQTKVSRLPFGPGSREEATPRTGIPRSRAAVATARIASRRSPRSRTTPRPTR